MRRNNVFELNKNIRKMTILLIFIVSRWILNSSHFHRWICVFYFIAQCIRYQFFSIFLLKNKYSIRRLDVHTSPRCNFHFWFRKLHTNLLIRFSLYLQNCHVNALVILTLICIFHSLEDFHILETILCISFE